MFDNQLENATLHHDDYTIQKIIYVNSAYHAFSEFRLDGHMAIFGKNNKGKTATLAGTKLLLFPEVNFKNVEAKFGFKGKDGTFNKEESFEFYFPCTRSFIIMQAENPIGQFCIILYKSNDFGYGRLFVPVPFDDIRDHFFDESQNDFNRDLSLQKIIGLSKSLGGINTQDEAEIIDLMYSGYQYGKEKARFCVIPIQNAGTTGSSKKSVQAFKKLFSLTFELSSQEGLASAIATLVEMGKSRTNEHLDADLRALSEQHEQLQNAKDKLDSIADVEPKFIQVHEAFKSFKVGADKHTAYVHAVRHHISTHLPEVEKQQTELLSSKEEAINAFGQVRQQYNNAKSELGTVNSDIKSLSRREGEVSELVLHGQEIIAAHPAGFPVQDMVDNINEEIGEVKSKLKNLEDVQNSADTFQQYVQKSKLLQDDIKEKENLLNKKQSLTISTLPDEQAHILGALHAGFTKITTPLEDDVKADIAAFTRHFSVDGGALYFLDSKLGNSSFSRQAISEEAIKADLKKLKVQLEDLNGDISDLQKSLNNQEHKASTIDKYKRELVQLDKELMDLSGLKSNESQLGRIQEELKKEREKQAICQAQMDEAVTAKDNALEISNARTSQYDSVVKTVTLLRSAKRDLEKAENLFPVSSASADVDAGHFTVSNSSLNQDVDTLYHASQRLNLSMGELQQGVQSLMRELPLDSDNDKTQFSTNVGLNTIEDRMASYDALFQSLEARKRRYFESVDEHHQLMSNQKNELVNAKNLLIEFINNVNDDMGEVRISNINRINLVAKLQPDFLNLIEKLEAVDLSQSQLVEKSVYENLMAFSDKHMDKISRTVKLESVLDTVEYTFLLDGKDKEERKSQSGGTSSAITALMLSVLLKRITPNYVRLNMPIIVDEIKTLDSVNASAMIKQVERKGFSLLCATPDFDGTVVSLTKQYIFISNHNIEHELMAPSCNTLTKISMIESWGEVVDEEQHDQVEEAVDVD